LVLHFLHLESMLWLIRDFKNWKNFYRLTQVSSIERRQIYLVFFFRIQDPGIEKGLSYLEMMAIVIIVLGSILLIIGFLGCCGAMKQVKLFLTCVSEIVVRVFLLLIYHDLVCDYCRTDNYIWNSDNSLFCCFSN